MMHSFLTVNLLTHLRLHFYQKKETMLSNVQNTISKDISIEDY